MAIDSYYTQQDGKWVRIDDEVVEVVFSDVRQENDPDFRTDFWVDICHGGGYLSDDRYYFPDRGAALDFYLEGWKERQVLDKDGNGVGLDHSGLYLGGRLVDGLSIEGDPPGHEGEHFRKMLGRFCEHLENLEEKE